MIGTKVERAGIIRHGAKMISAMSEATVPKISIVVRKAYGAGLYAMAGAAFEPDCCLALPTASIAVMGEARLMLYMQIKLQLYQKKSVLASLLKNVKSIRKILIYTT